MCIDCKRVSLPGMSDSELFLLKHEQEGVEFPAVLKRPILELEGDQCHTASQEADRVDRPKAKDEEAKEDKCNSIAVSSGNKYETPTFAECEASDADHDGEDDGFRTPTSSDHKIPAIKQCPPAPRKPKPFPSTKRKVLSSPDVRRNLLLPLDLSDEIDSFFPMPVLADLHRKIKRARREEHKE